MTRHTLEAFSVFPYFTKANASTDNQKRLQGLLYALKNGGQVQDGKGMTEDATAWFARELGGMLGSRVPTAFLGKRTFVVPMPTSSVTASPPSRSAWPMFDVAMLLEEAGAVAGAGPALLRHTAVQKGHLAAGDERPSVEAHADSISVDLGAVPQGCDITIMDDVLSSGTNAMGARLALRRAGFHGQVRVITATHTVAPYYVGGDTASAKSVIVWLEGRKDRAWRPSDEISFVD